MRKGAGSSLCQPLLKIFPRSTLGILPRRRSLSSLPRISPPPSHRSGFFRCFSFPFLVFFSSSRSRVSCLFQNGGPFHEPLRNVLEAYVCYRPDLGYVQVLFPRFFFSPFLFFSSFDFIIFFLQKGNVPCGRHASFEYGHL